MHRALIEKLIDKLANKELSFGCVVFTKKWNAHGANAILTQTYCYDSGWEWGVSGREKRIVRGDIVKILGHPILLGDVLDKMIDEDNTLNASNVDIVIAKWMMCGFTKSLQQIIEDSGWEEVEEIKTNSARKTTHPIYRTKLERLKDPRARALLRLIHNLINLTANVKPVHRLYP